MFLKKSQIYLEKHYNLFLKKVIPVYPKKKYFKLIIKKLRAKKVQIY